MTSECCNDQGERDGSAHFSAPPPELKAMQYRCNIQGASAWHWLDARKNVRTSPPVGDIGRVPLNVSLASNNGLRFDAGRSRSCARTFERWGGRFPEKRLNFNRLRDPY